MAGCVRSEAQSNLLLSVSSTYQFASSYFFVIVYLLHTQSTIHNLLLLIIIYYIICTSILAIAFIVGEPVPWNGTIKSYYEPNRQPINEPWTPYCVRQDQDTTTMATINALQRCYFLVQSSSVIEHASTKCAHT